MEVTSGTNPERAAFLRLLNLDKKIARAKGCYLYDQDGSAYLDFTSQYGAVSFGHNPEFLWKILVREQFQQSGNMIQPFMTRGVEQLSSLLLSHAPGQLSRMVLACTGAEAVEISVKLAKAKTKRPKILATYNGFHGKTMAAVLATGNPYYRESFYSDHPDFNHVPFNDLAALEQALATEDYAGFIVEPIQGEGGMVVPDHGYLKACEVLCKRYKTCFIVDEIQTGLGRTGQLFACNCEAVEPDIMLLSKTLGGGLLPISACLCTEKVWTSDFGWRHSSTFANNHLGAAIACEVVSKLVEPDGIINQVKLAGDYLYSRLQPLVEQFPEAFIATSGRGLMYGIQLAPWHDEHAYLPWIVSESGYAVALVSSYLLNVHRLLTAPTLNHSNVLRIQPCYLISQDQIDTLIQGLEDVGKMISTGNYQRLFRGALGMKSKELSRPKSRLIKSCPTTSEKKLGTFAFCMHPTSLEEGLNSFPGGKAAYNESESQFIYDWIKQFKALNYEAAPAFYIPRLSNGRDGYVDGWLISCPLTPREMMHLSKVEKQQLLESYFAAGRSKGATIIGLGAFTSVISRGGQSVEHLGLQVTTGNSFTALTSTEALRIVCREKNRPLDKMCFGVVGVAGSVGRLALLDLGVECRRVVLIGNPRNGNNLSALEVVAGELLFQLLQIESELTRYSPISATLCLAGIDSRFLNKYKLSTIMPGAEFYQKLYRDVKLYYSKTTNQPLSFPIVLSNQATTQLPYCDVVLTATSNGEAFISPESFVEGAIICDVARPSDLGTEVANIRPDVTVFAGGLVRLPNQLYLGESNILGLPAGINLACLSETMILALAQAQGNYSIQGKSNLEEARRIFQWGMEFGFTVYIEPSLSSTTIEQDDLVCA